MKDFLFISDFDGTLSDKDFYLIVIDSFLGEHGYKIMESWKNNEMNVFEYLKTIFGSNNINEEQLVEEVKRINIDKCTFEFVSMIKKLNGDFKILSAGASYYIEKIVEQNDIGNIEVIANKGVYSDGKLIMTADEKSSFYSKVYGIDKGEYVKQQKQEYKVVYFAGDSEPDFKAAINADLCFATAELQKLLERENHPFIPFDSFLDIIKYFEQNIIVSK